MADTMELMPPADTMCALILWFSASIASTLYACSCTAATDACCDGAAILWLSCMITSSAIPMPTSANSEF